MHDSSLPATAADTLPAQPGHAQEHDGGSIAGIAIKVFIALCVLTCASLLTYTTYWQEHVPMEIGRAVMLTVSLTKAFLVVVFFMHLWWESKWKYVVTFPAMAVSTLLCVALVPDIGQRTQQYDAARLLNAPEAMPYHVGPELTVSQPLVLSPARADAHGDVGHDAAEREDHTHARDTGSSSAVSSSAGSSSADSSDGNRQ